MGTDVLNPAGICGLKQGQNVAIELRTFPALRISYLAILTALYNSAH